MRFWPRWRQHSPVPRSCASGVCRHAASHAQAASLFSAVSGSHDRVSGALGAQDRDGIERPHPHRSFPLDAARRRAGSAFRSGARRCRRYRLGGAEQYAGTLCEGGNLRAAVRVVTPGAGQFTGDRRFCRGSTCRTNSAKFIPSASRAATMASCTLPAPSNRSRISRACGCMCRTASPARRCRRSARAG